MTSLPYLDVPERIGPISTFGILFGLGVLLGHQLARRHARTLGLDEATLGWLGTRLIIWGLIGAFVLNLVFYEWNAFTADPWRVITQLGISSYGALVAGALAFLYFARRRGLDARRWADVLAWGAAGGWLMGRLGCALVHDHLGRATEFALGVAVPPHRYPFADRPDAIVAHDLGLYEFLVWGALLGVLAVAQRWTRSRPGALMGVLAVAYAVPRFLLEFLRVEASDPRHVGLTFAQWCSLAALALGTWLLVTAWRRGQKPLVVGVARLRTTRAGA